MRIRGELRQTWRTWPRQPALSISTADQHQWIAPASSHCFLQTRHINRAHATLFHRDTEKGTLKVQHPEMTDSLQRIKSVKLVNPRSESRRVRSVPPQSAVKFVKLAPESLYSHPASTTNLYPSGLSSLSSRAPQSLLSFPAVHR